MMQSPSPHPADRAPLLELCEEPPGPLDVPAVWTRTDARKIDRKTGNPFGEPTVLRGVLLRSEVAAAAPRLVSDAPVPDPKRLTVAGRRAHLRKRRHLRRRVAVLDPLIKIMR